MPRNNWICKKFPRKYLSKSKYFLSSGSPIFVKSLQLTQHKVYCERCEIWLRDRRTSRISTTAAQHPCTDDASSTRMCCILMALSCRRRPTISTFLLSTHWITAEFWKELVLGGQLFPVNPANSFRMNWWMMQTCFASILDAACVEGKPHRTKRHRLSTREKRYWFHSE